jgi:hypothetical protein
VAERIKVARERIPKHDVWLQRVCGMPDYRES